jgi:hypothetical protein
MELFSKLKTNDIAEYRLLEKITTAHSISINNSSFYFNGKVSIAEIPDKNSQVLLRATIYVLFSNGEHVCNILVLDGIDIV